MAGYILKSQIPRLIIVILYFGSLAHCLVDKELLASQSTIHKRTGNETAASDLYGFGVRVGIYMQAIGILLSSSCHRPGGIKIACASTMIALLASWTTLAAARKFSACEAFLVITLVACLAIAATPTMSVVVVGETGIGNYSIFVASSWNLIVSLWLWSTLYKQLPLLETQGHVWFFVRVSLYGWFRILMLVLLCLIAVYTLFGFYLGLRVGIEVYRRLETGEPPVEAPSEDEKEEQATAQLLTAIGGGVYLIFTIAGAEMLIRYNNLTPVQQVTAPGQIIPFTIGIIVLVDGLWTVGEFILMRRRMSRESRFR